MASSPDTGIVEKGKVLLKGIFREPMLNLFWGAYGRILRNPEFRRGSSSILFVCTGNICRSPFAEHMFRKTANGPGRNEFRVQSAGIDVTVPNPSPSEAIEAALQFGVDLGSHRSRRITSDMVRNADMVLGMDAGHVRSLRNSFPRHRNQIFLLPLVQEKRRVQDSNYHRFNIFDPFGRGPDQFLDCFRRITECISDLLATLPRQGGGGAS